jgi:hypothetical protein
VLGGHRGDLSDLKASRWQGCCGNVEAEHRKLRKFVTRSSLATVSTALYSRSIAAVAVIGRPLAAVSRAKATRRLT